VIVLARKMKDVILAVDEMPKAALVSNVANVDRQSILYRLDVEVVAAMPVDQGIEQSDSRAAGNELDGEVTADET
jgi:hypothetical protein